MRPLLLLSILLLATASPPTSSAEQSAPNLVSVDGICSGAMYHVPWRPHETFVLTAAHCVMMPEAPIAIIAGDVSRWGTAVIVDHELDYAVIQASGLPVSAPALEVAPRVSVHEHVGYCGITLGYYGLCPEGTVAGVGDDLFLTQGFVWFGLSGSSIVNEMGQVLGVVSALPMDRGMPLFGLMISHQLPSDLAHMVHETYAGA